MELEPVIGLECHVQLKTKTKLFSSAQSAFGHPPNTLLDVVDLGLPGVLPVLNEKAVEYAVRLGLALGCKVHRKSVFARKHYFYPDLPKGYQISQHLQPICTGGTLSIQTAKGEKQIGITRIHIEEDAGKTIHVEGGQVSYLDFNRAGTPLLEVVTQPDLRSSEEAMAFFKKLRSIVMYLGICDGNLQEGSMRADLNVSLRPVGQEEFGTRTETKNVNSIRFLGMAADFEIRRQALEIGDGKVIIQETRLWDSVKKETKAMRSKEEAHDYRYFPDPDLPTLGVPEQTIRHIQETLPELAEQKAKRFVERLGLSDYDASVLTSEKAIADYFEEALLDYSKNPKGVANWVINDVLRMTKTQEEDRGEALSCPIRPQAIAELVHLIDEGHISGKIAKSVFDILFSEPQKSPKSIVEEQGWVVEKDTNALLSAIERVFQSHPNEVQKYRSGKTQVFGFLVGQVMKETKGKADPKEVNRLLLNKLE